eukprot:31077-Pelagococcus_subviridis.AAC.8
MSARRRHRCRPRQDRSSPRDPSDRWHACIPEIDDATLARARSRAGPRSRPLPPPPPPPPPRRRDVELVLRDDVAVLARPRLPRAVAAAFDDERYPSADDDDRREGDVARGAQVGGVARDRDLARDRARGQGGEGRVRVRSPEPVRVLRQRDRGGGDEAREAIGARVRPDHRPQRGRGSVQVRAAVLEAPHRGAMRGGVLEEDRHEARDAEHGERQHGAQRRHHPGTGESRRSHHVGARPEDVRRHPRSFTPDAVRHHRRAVEAGRGGAGVRQRRGRDHHEDHSDVPGRVVLAPGLYRGDPMSG